MEGGAVGHNFERDTHRNHLCQVLTLHRCFLPEEKIFLNSSQSETRIALGGHICWWNGKYLLLILSNEIFILIAFIKKKTYSLKNENIIFNISV
jgi:hypothetical protein